MALSERIVAAADCRRVEPDAGRAGRSRPGGAAGRSGRAGEDPGRDPGRDGDLPDSEREAAVRRKGSRGRQSVARKADAETFHDVSLPFYQVAESNLADARQRKGGLPASACAKVPADKSAGRQRTSLDCPPPGKAPRQHWPSTAGFRGPCFDNAQHALSLPKGGKPSRLIPSLTLAPAASTDARGRQMSGAQMRRWSCRIYADHRDRTRRAESPRRFSCFGERRCHPTTRDSAARGPLQTGPAAQHRHGPEGQRVILRRVIPDLRESTGSGSRRPA